MSESFQTTENCLKLSCKILKNICITFYCKVIKLEKLNSGCDKKF